MVRFQYHPRLPATGLLERSIRRVDVDQVKVRIFECQKKFVHSKVVLIDDWCTIGSSNLDRWNFRWNLEANQEMDDPVLAEELANMFKNDFSSSVEIDPGRWLRRSRFQRLSEWVWGQIDRWLTSLNPGDKS